MITKISTKNLKNHQYKYIKMKQKAKMYKNKMMHKASSAKLIRSNTKLSEAQVNALVKTLHNQKQETK